VCNDPSLRDPRRLPERGAQARDWSKITKDVEIRCSTSGAAHDADTIRDVKDFDIGHHDARAHALFFAG